MAAATEPVTERPGWKALAAHCQQVRRLHLRKLFAEDPERGERLTADAMGIYLDYSAIFGDRDGVAAAMKRLRSAV